MLGAGLSLGLCRHQPKFSPWWLWAVCAVLAGVGSFLPLGALPGDLQAESGTGFTIYASGPSIDEQLDSWMLDLARRMGLR